MQSYLTYTLAANEGDTCPPKPPLNCGCNEIILIFKADKVERVIDSLNGVLNARVASLSISDAPVKYTDPGSGRCYYVWKYDYLLEYPDASLSDPEYKVLKCDLAFVCCYGCAQAYTDKKLLGLVESVTSGASDSCGVDNTDPQNPTINPRGCFSGQDSDTVDYTYDSSTGVHSASVKVSGDGSNILEARGNGLYVPEQDDFPEPPVELAGVTDTNSVDQTLSAGKVLSADVKIDPVTNNILRVGTNGLSVRLGDVNQGALYVDRATAGNTNYGTEGNANNDTKQGPVNVASISNPSYTHSMQVLIQYEFYFDGWFENGAPGEQATISFLMAYDTAKGVIGTVADPAPVDQWSKTTTVALFSDNQRHDESMSRSALAVIAPGEELRVSCQAVVTHSSADSNRYHYTGRRGLVRLFGVALEKVA